MGANRAACLLSQNPVAAVCRAPAHPSFVSLIVNSCPSDAIPCKFPAKMSYKISKYPSEGKKVTECAPGLWLCSLRTK